MNTVSLPQLVWDGTCPLELAFPDEWKVEECRMAGHDRPALSDSAIRQAILHPLDALPISAAARGKREICLIFDDMSRPTRVARLVPHVLSELEKAGVTDNQIRFVCALGSHGALTRRDFVKKLGDAVVSRFPVFNHNLVGNCTFVGTTTSGVDLHINSEVIGCDYKIAVGSVVPHAFTGFGGGAKMILPGVASFETIRAMHQMKTDQSGARTVAFGDGIGCIEGNPIRETIEEAAVMVGLDFSILAIVDEWGETVSLHTGAPRAAFGRAVEEGRRHYLTPRPSDCDIVVANTFAKANEGEGGTITGFPSVRSTGGDMVLVSNAPEGHVTHYLFGTWGKVNPGEFRLVVQLPPQVERLIVFSEHRDLTAAAFFAPREKVRVIDSWAEVLRLLQERHGREAKVAVYSSAEIQYCGT
jgi:lactate racemase